MSEKPLQILIQKNCENIITSIHKQVAATGRNTSGTTKLTCDITTRIPMSCRTAIASPLKLYWTSKSSLL